MTQEIIKTKNIKEWGRTRELLIKYCGEESRDTEAKRELFMANLPTIMATQSKKL